MRKIIAKKDFITNNNYYLKGDEIKNLSYKQIVKLNELGFIESLDYKDLALIKRELENPKLEKEE